MIIGNTAAMARLSAMAVMWVLLVAGPLGMTVASADDREPVVEGLINPKPGDVFDGRYWDAECLQHLDDATDSIAYAKLHSLIPLGQCPAIFEEVCTGIHPVVTVNGCSLAECRELVRALCQQEREYFEKEQEKGRHNS